MAFETRDPFLIRQVQKTNNPFMIWNWKSPDKNVRLADCLTSVDDCLADIGCVQERENPTLTEWDRFAHREYIRLSMEEDVEDASNGSAEVWDESLEAPFWVQLG